MSNQELLKSNLLPNHKVELHRHLDCSMRFETMARLSKELGFNIPTSLEKQRDYFLITSPMIDLATVLNKFKRTQSLLCNLNILKQLALDTVSEAAEEGTKLLELRYSPTFIQEGHPFLSWDEIHQAFLEGITEAQKKFSIAVGLIIIIQRTLPPEQAHSVIDFALNNKNTIVGIDLADSENDGFDIVDFKISFQRAKQGGLHITVHAGEIPTEKSRKNIIDSIQILGAERIGHGIQAINSPEALQLLVKNKIPLEVCPTSNFLTQGVDKIENHPLRKLYEQEVLLTISTDDPGIFDLTLTSELSVTKDVLKFSLKELNEFQNNAFNHSFISPSEKSKISSLFKVI